MIVPNPCPNLDTLLLVAKDTTIEASLHWFWVPNFFRDERWESVSLANFTNNENLTNSKIQVLLNQLYYDPILDVPLKYTLWETKMAIYKKTEFYLIVMIKFIIIRNFKNIFCWIKYNLRFGLKFHGKICWKILLCQLLTDFHNKLFQLKESKTFCSQGNSYLSISNFYFCLNPYLELFFWRSYI